MKLRRYTQGITIFTSPQMYQDVKRISDEREISLSELFREMITEYLDRHQGSKDSKNSIS